jgi:bacteriorhodopsin
MLRYVFRALMALTLLVMGLARYSGGRLNPYEFLPFYYWFVISVFVFGAFGIYSLIRAIRDPHNRRAYLLDILLTVSWVPYWMAMLH